MKGRATNAQRMREDNRKLLLEMIRREPVSRAGLAVSAHLTRASVTRIVEELLAAGLVYESASRTRQVGRSPILLRIRGDARFVAGVNLRRGGVDVGFVTLGGEVLAHRSLPMDGTPACAQLDRMARALSDQRGQLGLDPERILGIGISAPGPLDVRSGVLLTPPNFDAWHHIPIADELRGRTGWPARLENVSNALALETRYFGTGRGLDSFMALQVNEGIGAGIVLGGQLYRGAYGLGGEVGHTSIAWDGLPCECGQVGCLEKYAAMPALLAGTPYASWSAVMDALPHAQAARRLLDLEASYLAVAIVNVLNLLDLDQVVLLGDLCDRPGPLLEALNGLVRARLIGRDTRMTSPVCCERLVSGVRSAAMAHIHAFYQEA